MLPPPPANTPYTVLTLGRTEAQSGLNDGLTSNSKIFCGVLYADSTRNVYFRSKYRSSTLNYTTANQKLISYTGSDVDVIGDKMTYTERLYWRLELDNYGVLTKGGHAIMYLYTP